MPNPLLQALDSIEAMLDSLRGDGPPDAQLFSKPPEREAKDVTSSSWMPFNGKEKSNPKEANRAQRDLFPRLGISKTIAKSRKSNAAKRSNAVVNGLRRQKKRNQKTNKVLRSSPKKRKSKTKKSNQNGGNSYLLGTSNDSKESGAEGHMSEEKYDQQFLQKVKNMAEQRRRAEKRRCEEKNAQITKDMNVKVGKTEEAMRNLVSSVAHDISKTTHELKHAPRNLDDELKKVKTKTSNEMKSLNSFHSSLKNLSNVFGKQVGAFRTEHTARTAKLTKEVDNITNAAKECVEERREFRNTLNMLEQILRGNGDD